MNKNIIKKLAGMTISNGVVDSKISSIILSKLSNADLKSYLFYLKRFIKTNEVLITLENDQFKFIFNYLPEVFKNKNIKYKFDPEIGAGFKIEFEDNIISMDVKNLIEQSIINIKNNL